MNIFHVNFTFVYQARIKFGNVYDFVILLACSRGASIMNMFIVEIDLSFITLAAVWCRFICEYQMHQVQMSLFINDCHITITVLSGFTQYLSKQSCKRSRQNHYERERKKPIGCAKFVMPGYLWESLNILWKQYILLNRIGLSAILCVPRIFPRKVSFFQGVN